MLGLVTLALANPKFLTLAPTLTLAARGAPFYTLGGRGGAARPPTPIAEYASELRIEY